MKMVSIAPGRSAHLARIPIANQPARRLAFLAGHREKRGGFLLHILAAAVRAADIFLVVFLQGKNCLKRLVAVVADVVVYGHGEHLACGLCENCSAI